MKNGTAFCFAWGLAVSAGAAAAQSPTRADSVVRAPPLRVDAVRAVTAAGAASALLIELDSLDVVPAASLEQVLRHLPLVTVRTNSRGEAQFSMRGSGSDARQVAVLMDGVPLHIGWDDRVDLSVVPAGAATTLTVIRGLPSVLHGPNVLGGVLEIDVTQSAPGLSAASGSADLAVDQTGAIAVSASTSLPMSAGSGDLLIRAGAGYRDRSGFAVPRGVAQSTSDAGADASRLTGEALRDNTDHQQLSAFLAGRYDKDTGTWLSLAASAFGAERGIAAELHDPQPRFWRYPDVRRAVIVASSGTGDRDSPLGGRGDVEVSVGYDAAHTEIVSFTGADYAAVDDTEEADDRTLTLRLLSDQTLGPAGELRLALTFVDTRHAELLSDSLYNDYRQRIWSAGMETVWRIPTGLSRLPGLRMSVGAALDGADTPATGDKPSLDAMHAWGARVGASATTAGGRLLVHAGVSRRARFPALRELYSGALGRFEPNPGLAPETLQAAEAGFTWRPASIELQAVAFYRNLDRAIDQITLPDGRRQRVNLGAVRSAGVELLGATTFGPVTLSADLTLQRVRLAGRNPVERTRPEYQPAIIAGAQAGVPLPLSLVARADVRYMGRQYCLDPTGGGELPLDASTRYDTSVSRRIGLLRSRTFGSSMEVSAAVDNILDSAIYDQCGLPQPGRTLRFQVSIR